MNFHGFRFLLTLSLTLSFPLISQTQEMMMSKSETYTQAQTEYFEKHIRPALIKHCFQCHSETGDKIKGGLLLDTRDQTRQGGDSGPAVVPGNLPESLLFVAITHEDKSLQMPPKKKLGDDVIAHFKKWIELGAPDPREASSNGRSQQSYTNTIDVEEGRNSHWAYQVPRKSVAPQSTESKSWARSPIDRFIYVKLAEKGLKPAEDADALSLMRRLSFDLTGLPPLPEESNAFAKAYAENPDQAVAAAVDQMLASPRFGERWGRHWLDVARYAESTGKETNALLPNAWRYRDYVIDSLNQNTPFDQFIIEQIAGDLVPGNHSPEEKARHQIATGFLAIGTKNLNEPSARQYRFDLVDEQIDTTTQTFLATTAACARCHDHKFDPIPMSDYYALAGIFLSSDTLFGTARNLQNRRNTDLVDLPSTFPTGGPDRSLGEVIEMEFQRHQLRETIAEQTAAAQKAQVEGDGDTAQRIRLGLLAQTNRLGVLDATLALYDDGGKRKPRAMGMRDRQEPFDSQILIRGEEDNATESRVPRGFLQVIQTRDEQPIPTSQSGRLQLAQWITSPENPLTSRVFVNRAWLWMFGRGLVDSVDNFGISGQKPTHPELLDYLAIQFNELNGSVKELVREIATSRTYRMSSNHNTAYYNIDPDNEYLWRANKRRLDAESIRDAILLVSGQLDLERPAGSVISRFGEGFAGRQLNEVQINADSNHRSVYLPIVRDLLPDALNLFDFADPSLISGKREVTTVASQALYLMNSEFMLKRTEAMAKYLTQDLKLKSPELGKMAFQLAFSRPPSEGEIEKSRAYFEKFIRTAQESGKNMEEARMLALTTFCQSLMCSAEFRYIN